METKKNNELHPEDAIVLLVVLTITLAAACILL